MTEQYRGKAVKVRDSKSGPAMKGISKGVGSAASGVGSGIGSSASGVGEVVSGVGHAVKRLATVGEDTRDAPLRTTRPASTTHEGQTVVRYDAADAADQFGKDAEALRGKPSRTQIVDVQITDAGLCQKCGQKPCACDRKATKDAKDDFKSSAQAAELGSKGGDKRAEALTPNKRHSIATHAANVRWE
jgi:hypothetical protein